MQNKKSYAIFGLGRYGAAVAKELVDNGMDVIAVDSNQSIVNEASAYLPVCKCADITDAEVLEKLGISDIDTVIICMASNLEASVMAVTLCKEAGVKNVIAKCATEMHQKILRRVGADKVVFPENESGIRLAKNLLSSGFIDMVSLAQDISVVELSTKDEWVGKSLIELDLRKKYDLNIIAIRTDNDLNISIDPKAPLKKNMTLIVIAHISKLSKLK